MAACLRHIQITGSLTNDTLRPEIDLKSVKLCAVIVTARNKEKSVICVT